MNRGAPAHPTAWWRCAIAALLPAFVVITLVVARFGAGPTQFLPYWNDEVVYWNEAAAFARAGFRGGYITVHEEPAAAALFRFGPHGPAYAVLQGSLGRTFGWRPSSAFAINLVIVSLAAFWWLRATPNGIRAPAVLLLAAFWPLLLYLPTNMQEPAHFAVAFVFAIAIARWREPLSLPVAAGSLVLVAAATLMRPTWALMILPLGWRMARSAGALRMAALVAITAVAAMAAQIAFSFIAAPYPNGLDRLAQAAREDPARGAQLLWQRTVDNLRAMIQWSNAQPTEVVFRYFVLTMIVVLAVRWFASRRRQPARAVDLEVALLIVLPVLASVLVVGWVEAWRDFRIIAPHVLVALLLLVTTGGWERWLWGATLLFLPFYWHTFVDFHEPRFTADATAIARMRDSVSQAVEFIPGAPGWTNTVLMHVDLLQYPLLGLPPGIGVSFALAWHDLGPDIRSRYLLLRTADRDALAGRVKLIPITDTPLGTLYRNADSVQ